MLLLQGWTTRPHWLQSPVGKLLAHWLMQLAFSFFLAQCVSFHVVKSLLTWIVFPSHVLLGSAGGFAVRFSGNTVFSQTEAHTEAISDCRSHSHQQQLVSCYFGQLKKNWCWLQQKCKTEASVEQNSSNWNIWMFVVLRWINRSQRPHVGPTQHLSLRFSSNEFCSLPVLTGLTEDWS